MKSLIKSIFIAVSMTFAACTLHAQPFELLSKSGDPNFYGGVGNQESDIGCSLSADGSRLVFESRAFNLFSVDVNDEKDVFIFEPADRSLSPVTANAAGEQLDDSSSNAAISASGRYVIFTSSASNLPDGGGLNQAYRYDTLSGSFEIVSLMDDGSTMPTVRDGAISGEGDFVVLRSDDQLWLRDIALGQTTLISKAADGTPAEESAFGPEISASGDYVIFYSTATNLVPDDTNGQRDVFVYDRVQDSLSRIMGMGNSEPNSESTTGTISADGQWIAFDSFASNLILDDTNSERDVFLYNRETGAIKRISEDASGVGGDSSSSSPRISPDGRFVAFNSRAENLVAGTPAIGDQIYLYDRLEDHLMHIETDGDTPLGSCIGNNGGSVTLAFSTASHPLIPQHIDYRQIVLQRFEIASMTRQSLVPATSMIASSTVPALQTIIGDDESDEPALSADGRYLAFTTEAGNIVGASPAIGQVVRLDQETGAIDIASLDLDEVPEEGSVPSISAQGSRIAFRSAAETLVSDDTNGWPDIFVRDLGLGQTLRVSIATDGGEANDSSDYPTISSDGSTVVFRSKADNLVIDDTNDERDIFVHRLASRQTERASVSTLGIQSTEQSVSPDISGSGRFVVFESKGNFSDGGSLPQFSCQIWLRDLELATTELISSHPDGTAGDGCSEEPRITENGRWIAFASTAALDPAFPTFPDSKTSALFLHDRQTGTTQLVSLDSDGEPLSADAGAPIASDASALLFQISDQDRSLGDDSGRGGALADSPIYVRFRFDGRTQRISPQTVDGLPPNADLIPYAIDAGGRHAYLVSSAGNLVSGMNNAVRDVYRVDLDVLRRDGFEAGIAGQPGPEN